MPHTRLPLSVVLSLIVTGVLPQVAVGQRPNNSHTPSAAENGQLDAAQAAADAIAAQLTGNAKKEAERCLKAWKLARDQGRVAILEIPPGARVTFRGLTTPDTPSPPSKNGTPATPNRGRYWANQSRWQWTCIEANFLATKCSCAVAVVILHEGWRLEQEVPTAPIGQPPAASFFQSVQQITTNQQNQSAQDLENIRAAKALAACQDPACIAELDALEAEARAALGAANGNAARLTRDGHSTPQVPAPY